MSEQHPIPALFKAPHNGTPTSKAAAEQKTDAHIDRTRMLAEYVAAGDNGVTDDEMTVNTGINPDSIRPRRNELIDAGLVEATLGKRPTRKGREAMVWRATRKATEGVQA